MDLTDTRTSDVEDDSAFQELIGKLDKHARELIEEDEKRPHYYKNIAGLK